MKPPPKPKKNLLTWTSRFTLWCVGYCHYCCHAGDDISRLRCCINGVTEPTSRGVGSLHLSDTHSEGEKHYFLIFLVDSGIARTAAEGNPLDLP